jgi:hypothetical protein
VSCICPPTGLGDPDCPKHGLLPGIAYPAMDRHAKPYEDARAAQRRLYQESMGRPITRECVICGFESLARWFEGFYFRGEGKAQQGFRCRSRRRCARRLKQRGLSMKQLRGRWPVA